MLTVGLEGAAVARAGIAFVSRVEVKELSVEV
jgi:hypothetical protein